MAQGLSSLLSDSDLVISQKVASFRGVKQVPIAKLRVNPGQPRREFDEEALQELAVSIKVHGVIQPITIREVENGAFEIISGERRFRASQLAGLEEIPAYMRNVEDNKSLELALIENLQRENLNPIEVALAYKRMVDECGIKQDELASRVGKKRSTVTNYLRLLQLPEVIQSALINQQISMGHARPLVSVDSNETQLKIFEKIIKQGLSVRKVEALTQAKKKAPQRSQQLDDHKEDVRLWLRDESKTLAVPVKVEVSKINKGNVVIPIDSEEALNELLELIG